MGKKPKDSEESDANSPAPTPNNQQSNRDQFNEEYGTRDQDNLVEKKKR
jgi:hypothetical protein